MNVKRTSLRLWMVFGLASATVSLATAQAPAPAPATLPATLEAALAAASGETASTWAFTATTRVLKDDQVVETGTVRVDPSRPGSQRCTVIALKDDKGTSKPERVGKPCSDKHDLPTYTRLARLLRKSKVAPLRETAEAAEFSVTTENSESFGIEGVHVSLVGDGEDRLVGTAHVIKTGPGAPYVDRLTLGLPGATGSVLARVQRLQIEYRYAVLPSTGARVATGLDIGVDLNFLGLLDMKTRVEQRFSDLRRLPPN